MRLASSIVTVNCTCFMAASSAPSRQLAATRSPWTDRATAVLGARIDREPVAPSESRQTTELCAHSYSVWRTAASDSDSLAGGVFQIARTPDRVTPYTLSRGSVGWRCARAEDRAAASVDAFH